MVFISYLVSHNNQNIIQETYFQIKNWKIGTMPNKKQKVESKLLNRYVFRSMRQEKFEDIRHFLARVRDQATSCGYSVTEKEHMHWLESGAAILNIGSQKIICSILSDLETQR